MQPTKLTISASVVSFIVGVVVGTGGYWKYQEIEISRSKATTDLRRELSTLMENVITTTAAFDPLNLCDSKTRDSSSKAIELDAKLALYQDNFQALEQKLARLEGRKPRKINLHFFHPCPPKAISLTISNGKKLHNNPIKPTR